MSCPVCGCNETFTGGNSGDLKCNQCSYILHSRAGYARQDPEEYRRGKYCPSGSTHDFDTSSSGRLFCKSCSYRP